MLKRLTGSGISLLLGAMLSMTYHPASAEVLVVVSAEAPFTRLTSSDLRDVYLGRRTLIVNGAQVVPLDLTEGTAARSEFYTATRGKPLRRSRHTGPGRYLPGEGSRPKRWLIVAQW